MPASIELKRRLRRADADAAGRLHFPRIFEVIEEAESELVAGSSRMPIHSGHRS